HSAYECGRSAGGAVGVTGRCTGVRRRRGSRIVGLLGRRWAVSERLTPERLAEIRERRDRAFDMISALCRPKGSPGSREWIMSIPARPDHDPDLVIGAALKDIDALLAHIDAQAEEIERLR